MLVCANCGRELYCSKTGKAVYFGNLRYAGDEYGCPECDIYVILTSDQGEFKSFATYDKPDPHVRGREFWHEPWSDEERKLYDSWRSKI